MTVFCKTDNAGNEGLSILRKFNYYLLCKTLELTNNFCNITIAIYNFSMPEKSRQAESRICPLFTRFLALMYSYLFFSLIHLFIKKISTSKIIMTPMKVCFSLLCSKDTGNL